MKEKAVKGHGNAEQARNPRKNPIGAGTNTIVPDPDPVPIIQPPKTEYGGSRDGGGRQGRR